MAEPREVFEMVTKQTEPDLDAWKQQEQRQRRATRNKKLGALAIAAVIGLAAVIVVIRADHGTGTQPGIQPTPHLPAGTVPETDYLIDLNTGETTPLPVSIAHNGLSAGAYAVSPDGAIMAYEAPDEAGTTQIFTANLDGTDVVQQTSDPRGAGSPGWGPDGNRMIAYDGFGDGDVRNIFVLDRATGAVTQITDEGPASEDGAVGPQFSPDGESIVYDVNRGHGWGVRFVRVTGGGKVPLLVHPETNTLLVGAGRGGLEAGDGTLSPDGSVLAMGCCSFPTEIWVANADGTDPQLLVGDQPAYLLRPRWSPDGTRIAYFNDDTKEVFVVDVATGESTFVAEGVSPSWLDDHTLIVEAAL